MLKRKTYFKLISAYLIFAMALISFPAQGWALFIQNSETDVVRKADAATIQKTLESTMLKQRLIDYGLSPDEAMTRINRLSNDQLHQFAAQLNSLQAGADGVDSLVFLLLVAILVVLIIELTGHHVIIR